VRFRPRLFDVGIESVAEQNKGFIDAFDS